MKHGSRKPGLAGKDLMSLMRKYRVSIRDLADAMDVTQKRVREVRAHGVNGDHFRQDWVEGIQAAADGLAWGDRT